MKSLKCLIGRHDDMLTFDGNRVRLVCSECGRKTHGVTPSTATERLLRVSQDEPLIEDDVPVSVETHIAITSVLETR